jgi:hypothetical protein
MEATAARNLGSTSAQAESVEHTEHSSALKDRQLLFLALIVIAVVMTAILVVYRINRRKNRQAQATVQALEEAEAKTSHSPNDGVTLEEATCACCGERMLRTSTCCGPADLDISQQDCWIDHIVPEAAVGPEMVDTDDGDEFSFGEAVLGPAKTSSRKELDKVTATSKDDTWASLGKEDTGCTRVPAHQESEPSADAQHESSEQASDDGTWSPGSTSSESSSCSGLCEAHQNDDMGEAFPQLPSTTSNDGFVKMCL